MLCEGPQNITVSYKIIKWEQVSFLHGGNVIFKRFLRNTVLSSLTVIIDSVLFAKQVSFCDKIFCIIKYLST